MGVTGGRWSVVDDWVYSVSILVCLPLMVPQESLADFSSDGWAYVAAIVATILGVSALIATPFLTKEDMGARPVFRSAVVVLFVLTCAAASGSGRPVSLTWHVLVYCAFMGMVAWIPVSRRG